jgi:hypothetical protein
VPETTLTSGRTPIGRDAKPPIASRAEPQPCSRAVRRGSEHLKRNHSDQEPSRRAYHVVRPLPCGYRGPRRAPPSILRDPQSPVSADPRPLPVYEDVEAVSSGWAVAPGPGKSAAHRQRPLRTHRRAHGRELHGLTHSGACLYPDGRRGSQAAGPASVRPRLEGGRQGTPPWSTPMFCTPTHVTDNQSNRVSASAPRAAARDSGTVTARDGSRG